MARATQRAYALTQCEATDGGLSCTTSWPRGGRARLLDSCEKPQLTALLASRLADVGRVHLHVDARSSMDFSAAIRHARPLPQRLPVDRAAGTWRKCPCRWPSRRCRIRTSRR